jgi:DNA-binding response OmpR family regulator
MQGYEAGADDYLVKPFDPEHLMAKIRVLIKYLEQKVKWFNHPGHFKRHSLYCL